MFFKKNMNLIFNLQFQSIRKNLQKYMIVCDLETIYLQLQSAFI